MTDFIERLETELLAAGRRSPGRRLARRAGRGAGVGAGALLSLLVVVGVVVALVGAGHGRGPAVAAGNPAVGTVTIVTPVGMAPPTSTVSGSCKRWDAVDGGGYALGGPPPFLLPALRCTQVAQYHSPPRAGSGLGPGGMAQEYEHRGRYAISVLVSGLPVTARDYGVSVERSSGGSQLVGVVRLAREPTLQERRMGGRILRASGLLPAGVVHFTQVIITRETTTSPGRTGGRVLLRLGMRPLPTTTSTTVTTPLSPITAAPSPSVCTGAAPACRVVSQINMTAPAAPPTKAVGIAQVWRQGAQYSISVKAVHLKANIRHDAYAVWLYNSATDARLLGFVNPEVGRRGKLSTDGFLPAGASRYQEILLTLERSPTPKRPGMIVLRGAFRE